MKISLKNISFSRNKKNILKSINLDIHENDKIALVGPNGSGKTSLMNIMTGINIPTLGSINNDFKELPAYKIGVHLQEQKLNGLMKVSELLKIFLFEGQYDSFVEKYSLENLMNKKISELSGGEKQKVFLTSIFQNNPVLFFLDEFTTGLDIESRNSMIDYLKSEIDNNKTLVLVTHYMEEAEKLCDRMIFMKNGSIIEDGDLNQLLIKYNLNKHIVITLISNSVKVPQFNKNQKKNGKILSIPINSDEDMIDILNSINSLSIPYHSYRIHQPELNDLYKTIYAL